MAGKASAFDLLRSSQRRTSAEQMTVDRQQEADISLRAPLPHGAVAANESVGLWWALQDGRVLYFPLSGPPGAPCAVHALPQGAAVSCARCVAVLGDSHCAGGSRQTALCTVVVCTDFRVLVFSQGECVDLPRPAGAPLGQAPAFVAPVATLPNGSGMVLAVGTASGRLMTLCLRQAAGRFEVEAGPLWPLTRGSSGLRGFFSRVRRTIAGGANAQGAEHEASPAVAPAAKAVEGVSAAPPGTLFAALALGDEDIAFYAQPQASAGTELLWTMPLSELLGLSAPSKLLAARSCGQDQDGLLLLYTGEAPSEANAIDMQQDGVVASRSSTLLARLTWPAPRTELPHLTPRGQPVAVGPMPQVIGNMGLADSGATTCFLASSGLVSVAAVRLADNKYVLSTICSAEAGLQVADVQRVDANILGLALTSEGLAAGKVSALTPHGMLDCRPLLDLHEQEDVEEDMGTADARALTAVAAAHELYAAGQDDRASAAVARAFARFGAAEVLEAVKTRTLTIQDADGMSESRWQGVEDAAVTRHLLFDKARDLHQWLAFLTEASVWTRLGGVPGGLEARQAACEACERVAAATRLRELHDCEPTVFAAAIRGALREAGSDAISELSESRRYYSRVSSCESLLLRLVDYPRALPLGSSDVSNAVLFANAAAAAFLEAALERRSQVIAAFPTLLPPPAAAGPRFLPGASPAPRGIGGDWLLSARMQKALEGLRLMNVEAMPSIPSTPTVQLLDAQVLRMVDSFKDLCRSTLRVAHASYGDLQSAGMCRIRTDVLHHLARAEELLMGPSPQLGAHRALLLAEEFEDIEAIVTLSVVEDPARLEEHMAHSPEFCLQALAQFLKNAALRPLFFLAVKRLQVPQDQLELLLAPYPELRWALKVQGLDSQAADHDWTNTFHQLGQESAALVQRERQNVQKRGVFAALAAIAQRASGCERPSSPSIVNEFACLGRLQGLCARFGGPARGQASEESESAEAPAEPEEVLRRLTGCIQAALPKLRDEGTLSRTLADLAQLVRLVERNLVKMGVDIDAFLTSGPLDQTSASEDTPAGTVAALQLLFAEVVLAEQASWTEVLKAPEGLARNALLSSLGFFCIIRWQEGSQGTIAETATPTFPRSAALDYLCKAYPSLNALAPALRLVGFPLPSAAEADAMQVVPPTCSMDDSMSSPLGVFGAAAVPAVR